MAVGFKITVFLSQLEKDGTNLGFQQLNVDTNPVQFVICILRVKNFVAYLLVLWLAVATKCGKSV